jgi:hypothetical protein
MNRDPPSGPAVLVMARAPRPGQVRRALEPLLGTDGCAALQAALIVAAVRWAHAVAPGAVHVAHDPPDAAPEMRALLPAETSLFPQNGEGIGRRLSDATARSSSGPTCRACAPTTPPPPLAICRPAATWCSVP